MRTSKLGVALRIFGVAPKVDEKGVALKVSEKAASHLIPIPDLVCILLIENFLVTY